MEGDGLPNQVCLQCVHYINRAFSFKQLCERSDATLRQYLEKPLFNDLSCKDMIPLVQVHLLDNTEPGTQVFIPVEVQKPVINTKNEIVEPKLEVHDLEGPGGKQAQLYLCCIDNLKLQSLVFYEKKV